jgi:DNA-binding NarL/FixJ family response regulator
MWHAAWQMILLPRKTCETEVLRLIAEGFTTGEVADKLFVSKRTIETHRQSLLGKTQAKNTASLIKLAMSKGLI